MEVLGPEGGNEVVSRMPTARSTLTIAGAKERKLEPTEFLMHGLTLLSE